MRNAVDVWLISNKNLNKQANWSLNGENGYSGFLKEFEQIWREIEKLPAISASSETERDQIRNTILLYLQSQALTDFFGLKDKDFRKALNKTLQSQETNKVYFLDILGAHAWANPCFHSYFYDQLRAYVTRNHSAVWNLVVQDNQIRKKIEERIAKHIDIDEVMPDYNSGDIIGLHIARILSWEDEDMKSDVAKDLIDLHRAFNIPLFYYHPDYLKMLLKRKDNHRSLRRKVEFHLALDKNDEVLPGGCWIYEEQGRRKQYEQGDLAQAPKDIIQDILEDGHCIFAAEKWRELQGERKEGIRILAINSPTKDIGGFKGSPTSLLYALGPLIDAIKEKRIDIVSFSHLNIFDPTYARDDLEWQLKKKLKEIEPHAVLISSTSLTLHFAQFMARIVKQETPNTIVIIGGPHCDEVNLNTPQANPNSPLSLGGLLDFMISGDGEWMLLILMQTLVSGMRALGFPKEQVSTDDLKKYVLTKSEDFRTAEGKARIHFKVSGQTYSFDSSMKNIDLSKLGPLRYEVLKKEHLEDFPIFQDETSGKTEKCVQVMTHRGCFGSCNFCSERVPLYGLSYYYNEKEVDTVISELQHYVDKFGIRAVFFDDSTFMENPDYVKKLCERMRKSGLPRLRWGCLNRFDKVKSEELIRCMTEAGLDYMYLGLEIKDDKALRDMNKSARSGLENPSDSLTTDVIEKTLQTLMMNNVRVGVSILFGLPYVSEETEKETIEWVGRMVSEKKITLVSLSLFNHHEASLLSQTRAQAIGLNYLEVEENIKIQNTPPWNSFEEGGWFHSGERAIDVHYLARLLWKVDQEIDKNVLVRKAELEQFMRSEWAQALRLKEEAFEIIQKLEDVQLSDFAVVSDYVIYDDQQRQYAKDVYQGIIRDLEHSKPSYWLVWGESRSGKTYFFNKVGEKAKAKGFGYERLDLSSNQMTEEEDFARALNAFEKQASRGPLLCFIDEIASRPQLTWPFTRIKSFIDNIKSRNLPIILVLAGSHGKSVRDLEDYIESDKNQGKDMIWRIKTLLNKYSVPDMKVGDRIIIALSCIRQAGNDAGRKIKSVEKSALYWIALSPNLKYPGPIRDTVAKAVQRRSEKHVVYDDFFHNDREQKDFQQRMKDTDHLRSLTGKFVTISGSKCKNWPLRAEKRAGPAIIYS